MIRSLVQSTAWVAMLLLTGCTRPDPALRAAQARCNSIDVRAVSTTVHHACLKVLPVRKRERLCWVETDGKREFVGEPECFATLPRRDMSGYMLYGLTHTSFHPDLGNIDISDISKTVFMELDSTAQEQIGPYPPDFTVRLYEVRFTGSELKGPGSFYLGPGHVYAWQFKSFKEIPQDGLSLDAEASAARQ